MRLSLLFLFLIIALNSSAQVKNLDKIQKILGHDYVVVSNFIGMQTDSTNPVYSRCVEDLVIGQTWQNEYVAVLDTLDRITVLSYRFTDAGFTSKAEFLEFRTWVRDSIARLKLL